MQQKIRKNHQIDASKVNLVIEGEGSFILSLQEALQKAKAAGLDLIEINSKVSPPICKILDFGKFKYNEKKKAASAKKNQNNIELKELTLRPNIDDNDLNHKLEAAKKFLSEGNKVKFTLRFRGREVSHPQIGSAKLEFLLKELTNLIAFQPKIVMEGKIMSMIVQPK